MKTTYLPRLTLLACAATLSAGAMGAGDPAAGAIKSFTCMGCHGVPSYNNVYPTYKVPKLVEFRDELPKTNVGKILRRELRDSA